MDEKVYKPKLRITTLEENLSPISDRLVDAYTELNAGPKIQHNGPIKVEVTLTCKQDIENFKTYLDRLTGNLPLKEISQRGRPSSSTEKALESPREDILLEVENMVKEGKTQDEVIKYLRGLGFTFILTEDLLYYFPDFPFIKRDIGEPTDNHQYPNSYSWLIRCIKRAKDPKTDKFDPMIMFGFSILNGPSRKVIPYLYKERKEVLKVNTGKKVISFSKAEFTKMPVWMREEERLKFSSEQRALILNPEKQPSKFFTRWASDVRVPKVQWEKLKDRVPSLKVLEDPQP
jgi:hypothetical protein|nr:MAG TPA: hypothetical protein [Caudoviricetes sp.]